MFQGKRLKEVRTKCGFTQEELGKLVNLGKSAICCYEKGIRVPTIETIIKFMDIFGVSANYLLGTYQNVEIQGNNIKGISLSDEEINFIITLRKEKNIYNKLVDNPIYGIELIKKNIK